jgi:hypothetical protein
LGFFAGVGKAELVLQSKYYCSALSKTRLSVAEVSGKLPTFGLDPGKIEVAKAAMGSTRLAGWYEWTSTSALDAEQTETWQKEMEAAGFHCLQKATAEGSWDYGWVVPVAYDALGKILAAIKENYTVVERRTVTLELCCATWGKRGTPSLGRRLHACQMSD